jgi:hydrogenase/urease accessory protein HupE
MKKAYFLILTTFIWMAVPTSRAFGHIISSDIGHSYGTIYTVLYFIARIIPFIGLGILAQYPARKIGFSKLLWKFFSMFGAGIVLGYHFHDYFSTAFFNYLLTVVIGFLIIFNSGKHTTAIQSLIILSCLPLGFEFGLHFSHADAWLSYMIAICLTSIAAYMGFSYLFMKLDVRYRWVQQSIGVILVIAGIVLILLF